MGKLFENSASNSKMTIKKLSWQVEHTELISVEDPGKSVHHRLDPDGLPSSAYLAQ